jgi:hypothetical protein
MVVFTYTVLRVSDPPPQRRSETFTFIRDFHGMSVQRSRLVHARHERISVTDVSVINKHRTS